MIPVWDPPVRIIHWLLVILVASAWVSAEFGDINMTWHRWNGYILLTLLLFRLQWGFIGSPTSKFRNFVRGPGSVIRYLSHLTQPNPPHYAGHNPAGGWMVLALLAMLLLQAVTGLFSSDDILVEGPLAFLVSDDAVSLFTTIHTTSFYFLLALIAIHIGAIVFYKVVKGEDLTRPMIHGNKEADKIPEDYQPIRCRPLWALPAFLVSIFTVWFFINVWHW